MLVLFGLRGIICLYMDTQAGFIFKVLLVSTLLSVLIKYGGEYVPIQPTATNALAIVLLPSIIVGFILGRQYLHSND